MIAYTKKEADTENFSLLLLQKKEMKEKKNTRTYWKHYKRIINDQSNSLAVLVNNIFLSIYFPPARLIYLG